LAVIQEGPEELHHSVQTPLAMFMYALKAPETKRQWPRRLNVFLEFLGLEGTIEQKAEEFFIKSKHNVQWTQDNLLRFMSLQYQRVEQGKISDATVPNYYKAIKLFCEMNDLVLNWKKVSRGMPKGRQAANDRAPTVEELEKLVEYPDRRIKPIVYTMASSGIRIGAWDYLQWKHVKPISGILEGKEVIAAAKLLVYAGDREEYYTFIPPEAYLSLKEWMDFRASYGEKITSQSWLMRDIWQTTNIDYRAKSGLATAPRKLKSSGIKRLLERALWEEGIREPLKHGQKRHEWKAAHGFRKFYKSRAEQLMKPINVEITMGHNIGISKSYYKPTEKEVMDDYLKAIDLLTINGDKIALQKQVTELREKTKDNEYIIREKLLEKEEQIKSIQYQLQELISAFGSISNESGKQEVAKRLIERGMYKNMDSNCD